MNSSNDKTTERMFRGQARLIRLLLWKVGESTDLDACLQTAQETLKLDADDAAFLRTCLDAEERCREAESLDIKTTPDIIARLRRYADKLNRADSA
jgi:hypothetical protein